MQSPVVEVTSAPPRGRELIVRREIRSVVLNVRIRPSLKALLEKCAERDGQSLSGWIETVLAAAAEKAKPKPK